jgi:hypothetical protein
MKEMIKPINIKSENTNQDICRQMRNYFFLKTMRIIKPASERALRAKQTEK